MGIRGGKEEARESLPCKEVNSAVERGGERAGTILRKRGNQAEASTSDGDVDNAAVRRLNSEKVHSGGVMV